MKTSTFTIDHDRCDPAKWTPADVLVLAKFITTGNLGHAAHMSRLGMKLERSEHHEPLGGTLEKLGFTTHDGTDLGDIDDVVDDDNEVAEVHPVYRGHVEYAVRFGISDDGETWSGSETEIFSTREEAEDFLRTLSGD